MRDVSPEEAIYQGLNDEELMERLGFKDLPAFRALYKRFGNMVYSTSLRIVRDGQVAEDVTQEIFLRIWRKPESYVPQRGRFLTWLTSVTRNRAVDEVRSRNRRYRHETASPEQQEMSERLSQALGTVKTRIRLGMQKLRAALTPELNWEER